MCRIIATVGAGQKLVRTMAFHQSFLASAAQNQPHGWGITDGLNTLKSMKSVAETTNILALIKELDIRRTVHLGHLRAASSGTGMNSSMNSHPYVFMDKNNKPIIAVHNGWVDGTRPYDPEADQADTDSYRALEELALSQEVPLNKDKIQSWLRTLSAKSSYSFMFVENDKLIGVRGHRTLFYMLIHTGVGTCLVLNTSDLVLGHVASFLGELAWQTNSTIKCDEIKEIAEATYFEIAMVMGKDDKPVPDIKRYKIDIGGQDRPEHGIVRFVTPWQ